MLWSEVNDGAAYIVSGDTMSLLPPGIYEPAVLNGQVLFVTVAQKTESMIRFPNSPALRVTGEIEEFWKREKLFANHGLSHKRGILLWGPPGAGKSATMQQVAQDVADRGGLVLIWSAAFVEAYRVLRRIQPETPVVVLMEDLDAILSRGATTETAVLNLLDGVEALHRVVFVASTNYPEKLGERVVNRPSRFDRKVKIGYPDTTAREMYLESLLRTGDDIDVGRWVADTKGFSIAHLKELFVATVILGNDYGETLRELKRMSERASSAYDGDDFTAAAGYA